MYLKLITHIVDTYIGVHPENRIGEILWNTLNFQFSDTTFPHIRYVVLINGLFNKKVVIYVNTGALNGDSERHEVKIPNADFKRLFKKATAIAKQGYKDRKAEELEKATVKLRLAAERFLNKEIK